MCKEAVVAVALYLLAENEESHANCRNMAGVWLKLENTKWRRKCVFSDFRHDIDKICPLPGFYIAYSDKYVQTFRDNQSVPSSKFNNS